MESTIIPVIISGGSGSRLWPVSRSSYPKQFWPLVSDKTLIQETALRCQNALCTFPIIVCNSEHRFIVAEQLRNVGISRPRIILEPVGRNSAPAIAAAAFITAETNPDSILWIMAADAAITDEKALQASLKKAVIAARNGRIVTFGMTTTYPETGYGYIKPGPALRDAAGVFEVASFVEKPNIDQAQDMVSSKKFLWNSGMFVTKANVFLSELKQYAPDVYEKVQQAVAKRHTDLDFERLDVETFTASPDISVDYAVAERTQMAAVVRGNFGWSDVGSWSALWDLSPKDADGNVTSGDVYLDGTKNCYVRSDGIIATVTGVKDLVMVVTQDAVMVSHKDRTQDIKHMVARLTKEGRKEAIAHNRSYRPWGFYESLIQADRFQVKRIVVEPGAKLSLQKHFHRAEHWVVVGGTAQVTRDEEVFLVRENESIYLPLGCVHRLENPGKIPLALIEIQSGPYLGEDDIVRLEDIYARN